MKAPISSRRSFLGGISSLLAISLFRREAKAATITPSATEGPFYPTSSMRMKDVDNDLVKVEGLVKEAGGRVILLNGQITDQEGKPRAGVRIEIWQCDVNGKYLHPGDNRNVDYDTGFQGFGYDITGEDGRYSFRTIEPGKYPGRTPHIHVKVFDGEKELLTTQFYVAGDPGNKNDSLFRRMSPEQAKSVSMRYTENGDGKTATVNIRV